MYLTLEQIKTLLENLKIGFPNGGTLIAEQSSKMLDMVNFCLYFLTYYANYNSYMTGYFPTRNDILKRYSSRNRHFFMLPSPVAPHKI